MRRRGRKVIVFVLVALGVVGVIGVLARLRPRPLEVETVRLERADVAHTLALRGRLQRRVDVEVRPPIAGWVSGEVPEIGRHVEKGERLFRLRTQEQFVAQVRAALTQQKDARQALRWQSRVPVPSPIAGRLVRFDVSVDSRVAAGQRLATVQPPGASEPVAVNAPIAGKVLPFLVGPGDEVAPSGELPLLFLVPAEGRVASDAPGAAQATARLQQARADLERLSLQAGRPYPDASLPLDRAFVTAPLSGEVTWRALGLTNGTPVSPEQRLLALASAERILLATVHEVDYPSVDSGQPASITFDAYPERALAASFVSKSRTPAQTIYEQFSEYTAVFALSDPVEELPDGMTGNLTVTVESRSQVESLPLSVLTRRDGRSLVWVRDGERFRALPVEVGLVGDERVEIRSGVRPVDEVVLAPELLPKTLQATAP